MSSQRRYAAALWGVCLGLWGCEKETTPLTQIVVVVNSDLSVPTRLDQVSITIEGAGSSVSPAKVMLGESDHPLPVSLGLVHEGGPLGPLTVRALGLREGVEITERAAKVSFRNELTLELQLLLAQDCVACLHNESCEKSSCNVMEITSLPVFDGDLGVFVPTDRGGTGGAGGGQDAAVIYDRDAGSEPDAGTQQDGGAADGGMPTAGTGGMGGVGGMGGMGGTGAAAGTGGMAGATTAGEGGDPQPTGNQPPVCVITEPADGSTFVKHDTVTFRGSCTNAEGGAVYLRRWESDLDGTLSYLDVAVENGLSVGTHVISFCGTDPFDLDLEGCVSIMVTIAED